MDEPPEIKPEEEDFKDDIIQFETSMVVTSVEFFKKKKNNEFSKQPKQPRFDLMSLFQLQLYQNPQDPIKISDSDYHVSNSEIEKKFQLDNKIE